MIPQRTLLVGGLFTITVIILITLGLVHRTSPSIAVQSSQNDNSGPLTRNELPLASIGTHKSLNPKKLNAFYLCVIDNKKAQLNNWKKTIQNLQNRFLNENPYPFIILSEKELDKDFQKDLEVITDKKVKFGLFDKDYDLPKNIDIKKTSMNLNELRINVDKSGDDIKVHQLNRYKAGYIFNHKLVRDYDYFMRLDPEGEFLCDFNQDPFSTLKEKNFDYGFIQTSVLHDRKMLTLWDTVTKYLKQKEVKSQIPKDNSVHFITKDNGKEFNFCSFRNQFDLGSVKLFQSDKFKKYFEFLDKENGFFDEMWSDVSVQSTYVALFVSQPKIHWFGGDLGYQSGDRITCPTIEETKLRCDCDAGLNNDYNDCYDWHEIPKRN